MTVESVGDSRENGRADFEIHVRSMGYDTGLDARPGREGEYWSSHTQLMWVTWQRARGVPIDQLKIGGRNAYNC